MTEPNSFASLIALSLHDPVFKKEALVSVSSVTKGEWVSVEIPLSDYTNDSSKFMQLVWDGDGEVYIDNLYFVKK